MPATIKDNRNGYPRDLTALAAALAVTFFSHNSSAAPHAQPQPSPMSPASPEPLRSASYQPVKHPAYDLKGKDVGVLAHSYCGNAPERPLLCDIFFRIDEDLVSSKATIKTSFDNNDDAREKAREKLFHLANEIGARIKEVENTAARRATTEECINAFNHVLFTAENFKFPDTMTMLRSGSENKRISFSSALNEESGVCADVTGIYLSLVDVLARHGLRFEVAAKQAPGHVFACWKDGDRETNVELTAAGKVITDEEYRKSIHIGAGSSNAMSLDTCGLASLLHNSALALVDRRPELALRYSKIRLELDKSVGAYQLRAGILMFTLGSNPEKRSSIFEEISKCAERCLEMDPEGPTLQLLALRMRADREPDKEKRLALIDEALNYVRERKEKGLTNRPSTLLGITIENSGDSDLAELYLAKYEITGDQKDLYSADVATLRVEAAALLEIGAIRRRAPLAFASARAHKNVADLTGFLERVNVEIEKCVRDSLASEAKTGSRLTSAAEARLAKKLEELDSSQHSLRRSIAIDGGYSPRSALEVRALTYLQMADISATNGADEASDRYYRLAGEDFKMVLAPSAYEEGYPPLEVDLDGNKIEIKPRAKRDVTRSARSEENVQALVGLAVCQHTLGETVLLNSTIVKLKTLLEIGNETFADYVKRREQDFRDYRDVSWKADRASLERLIANPELVKCLDIAISE